MRKLLIATKNPGKFREVWEILRELPFEFLTLNDFKEEVLKEFEVEESGKTFKENAILKAESYGRLSGLLTLADDSGLCVNYLKGGPGVKTHRYHLGSDRERYEKLLKEMKDIPEIKRRARFVSVTALFSPKTGKVKTARGECHGRIAFVPKGRYGFGFDPIFIVNGLSKHLAELTLKEKKQVSHRAKALRRMRKILLRYCSGGIYDTINNGAGYTKALGLILA